MPTITAVLYVLLSLAFLFLLGELLSLWLLALLASYLFAFYIVNFRKDLKGRKYFRLFGLYLKFVSMIIVIGFALGVSWWAYNLYKTYNLSQQQEPFWTGTEIVRICKMPYQSSDDCEVGAVNLPELINENAVLFHPGQKNQFVGWDLECWYSAKFWDYPLYTFCKSWDSDDQQWDIMPVWAYLPSTEVMNKKLQLEIQKIETGIN